jgi:hypothetical protein
MGGLWAKETRRVAGFFWAGLWRRDDILAKACVFWQIVTHQKGKTRHEGGF